MTLTLVQLAGFVAGWRRLGLTDEYLRALEGELAARPEKARVRALLTQIRTALQRGKP